MVATVPVAAGQQPLLANPATTLGLALAVGQAWRRTLQKTLALLKSSSQYTLLAQPCKTTRSHLRCKAGRGSEDAVGGKLGTRGILGGERRWG